MKQGELAKILDRSPMEIGRTRKKICNSDDFNEETKELTESGIEKLKDYYDFKALEPQFIKVTILYNANNPKFVVGTVLENGKRKKVRVCIPMNLANHLTEGKIFEAQVIEYNGEKYYRHKKIRDGYYPRVHQKAQ
tara:strand:+ start:396 stop:803 length:408 start_codon:yes stop_codon:yes gene_type:complete